MNVAFIHWSRLCKAFWDMLSPDADVNRIFDATTVDENCSSVTPTRYLVGRHQHLSPCGSMASSPALGTKLSRPIDKWKAPYHSVSNVLLRGVSDSSEMTDEMKDAWAGDQR